MHLVLWSWHASAQIEGKRLNACQPCNLGFFRLASLALLVSRTNLALQASNNAGICSLCAEDGIRAR